jgi:hypothetical protein
MNKGKIISGLIAITLALVPAAALAQGEMSVEVESSVTCDAATLLATFSGGTIPYELNWSFGDTDTLLQEGVEISPVVVDHQYPEPGAYDWTLTLTDAGEGADETSGLIVIDGPAVSLDSVPFPPIIFLDGSVDFTANVEGGVAPYSYAWDLDGDGTFDLEGADDQASFSYSEPGKVLVTVVVTDDCGLSGEATLPVVVLDPEAEACHPMAQRIADAVNTLFPSQAETLYTCEDIFAIFEGALTGSQVGFGRLWHAYKLSLTIEELTWEEIRDWHLDSNGWGLLVQLDRFADSLDQFGIRELVDLVLSGEASVGDIRHAARSVIRYEADFEDALTRILDGASPGELGRFYRTAQDLELDAAALDEYLEAGYSLQELSHAARVAERTESDWTQIAEAHAAGHSWGAIGQAQRLAGEGEDWMTVLENGIRETRKQIREQARTERSENRDQATADRLAAQYDTTPEQVLALYYDQCGEKWNCVRQELRNGSQTQGGDQDAKTAARLARQYGIPEGEVWALFDGSCSSDWNCVRQTLRESYGPGGGPKKND